MRNACLVILKLQALKQTKQLLVVTEQALVIRIRFENTTDVNNMDNFITAINAVCNGNPFAKLKQAIIENVTHQFYKLNNTENPLKFSVVGGASAQHLKL